MNKPAFTQHPGKVAEMDKRFEHVMAITLDPRTGYKDGIIRCITSRSGEIGIKGNLDRSALHKVHGDSLEHFEIGERLAIKNEGKIIGELTGVGGDFIGLEDPDIWIDEKTDLMHVYFTIPIKYGNENYVDVGLGHAVGKNIDSLEMTSPALAAGIGENLDSAKEVSIAPLNKQGVRLNLIESYDRIDDIGYSTVRIAIAEDMGKPWQYGETVFHPAKAGLSWIGGHASPGPLFPKSFIDISEGRLVGVMNGREANEKVGDIIKYGMFSVGLFIYNYEKGEIEWVSPEPFIQDTEAVTITFASQFVEGENGTGILYAHVDDSFVRAYTLDAEGIKALLPPGV